jgi:hypothetical protein
VPGGVLPVPLDEVAEIVDASPREGETAVAVSVGHPARAVFGQRPPFP